MRPVDSTVAPPLEFSVRAGLQPKVVKAAGNKIGWIRAISDKPNAKYNIIIKDGLGRVKMEKVDCGNATDQYGELVNLSTMMGEDLSVEVENVRGAESLKIFLN